MQPRTCHAGRCLSLGALAVAVGTLSCGDDGTGPPTVASVAVTSPIGDRLAMGRTVQLSADARDSRGGVVPNVTFAWSSSAPTIAQVSASGVASGVAAGPATLSAQADGVTGSLAMRVIAADLDGIPIALNDAFTTALVTGLTSEVRTRVQAALTQCSSGAAQGNFTTIEDCLTKARAEVTGATDPTDRALLATLALFLDHVERLLNT